MKPNFLKTAALAAVFFDQNKAVLFATMLGKITRINVQKFVGF
jgi:hypothetical protein